MKEGPTWLGIGAQRSGTTWFTDLLIQHPQMDVLDGIKEHNWLFRYGLTQDWDETARQEYRRAFASDDLKIGEFTPFYLRASWLPSIVGDALPEETPILVLLRDPIDRFASALRKEMDGAARRYREWVEAEQKKGEIPKTPIKTRKARIQRGMARVAAAAGLARVYGPPKPPPEAFLDRTWLRFVSSDATWAGMYSAQLHLWTSILPEERFIVIQYEKLRRDPQHYADLVWKRLGLDPVPLSDTHEMSRSSVRQDTWVPDDYPDVVRALQHVYRPDAERLAERFDIDLTLWKRTMS